MRNYRFFAVVFFLWMKWACFAQINHPSNLAAEKQWDTGIAKIKTVDVNGAKLQLRDLPDYRGVSIFSGKKLSVVVLDQLSVNLAENNARQIFAKVPGITAMEMDGSGVQVNIGSRGLNPHRSMEINVNQNGININSDLFGYPEVHYSPPMEAVGSIEIAKGSASLQYGPQFGGMVNYILKSPDTAKVIGGQSTLTVGSFGSISTFTTLGGQKGKWRYMGYFNYRGADGWRQNSRYDYWSGYGSVYYQLNKRTSIGIELSQMAYTVQLPGGLTEQQFELNPRLSLRERNYYSPQITIPAVVINSEINQNTTLNVKSYVLLGQRNSVAFIASPLVADSVNVALGTKNPRQVDRDFYRTFTTDIRLLHRYQLFGMGHIFTQGYKYSYANTQRQQFGKGTVNSDFDITLTDSGYGVDLLFRTVNNGIFFENLFRISDRWTITPGLRYDNISSKMTGDLAKFKILDKRYNLTRNVLMKGVGSEFKWRRGMELYANYANAYHPVLHSDLIPSATLMEVDSHLKDSKGYNFDIGMRGKIKDAIRFDVSYFRLYYGNRIGSLTRVKPDGTQFIYRTNIGNSLTTGLESLLDVHIMNLFEGSHKNDVNVFCSYAVNQARYLDGTVVLGKDNLDISGHKVEDVADYILRSGVSFRSSHFMVSVIYSKTGQTFSDANNTLYNGNGITGLIPSFHVIDFTVAYQFLKRYSVKLGVNNLENTRYFNRRVSNYLGPGILPAAGRSALISFGIKL